MHLFLWLLCALATAPQHQHDAAPAQAATLLPGMGRHHHPIATTSPEAQRFFDQGLTLLYGFNHDEAIRSFRRAAELDPRSPMPHWGIALALGPNINLDVDPDREKAAHHEAQVALRLAGAATPVERAYVAAVATRYSDDPTADLKALAVRYKDAMHELSRRFPTDLDAATLYAESLMDLHPWQLWAADGTPTEGTLEIVSVLEGVIERDPSHIGANHYYIHAVEASPAPERALPSADRLRTLVPNAGHLVHMPAHIYMRTGDYAGAVKANAVAADVDRKYIDASRPSGVYPAMYYGHNLDFLASAAMMTGQFKEAARAADELVALVTPMLAEMPMVEPFGAKKLYVLYRFGKWQEILALPAPSGKYPILSTLSHFGRASAHAALGDVSAATREVDAYRQARGTIPEGADWGYNKATSLLAVTDRVLDARLAAARGDLRASAEALAKAVAAQDTLNYNEPPDWFYPVRESLGAVLMRAGRFAEAEQTFRKDLTQNPSNPRSLYGLWKALDAQHKPSTREHAAYTRAAGAADTPIGFEMF